MDTGQIDAEHIEEQMRQTRVRLDHKLDALNARTSRVRQQAGWVMPLLVGAIGAVIWRRARRRRHRRDPFSHGRSSRLTIRPGRSSATA
jgi:hypothetical protein